MSRPQTNPARIKTDKQFERFCEHICKEHGSNINYYRYAIQLDRLPQNIPELLNKRKNTASGWLLYMEQGFYVLFVRNKYGLYKWLNDYTVIREYHNPRPRNWSRSFSNIPFSKLTKEEYTPEEPGYDCEIDIVKNFMKQFDIEIYYRDYSLRKKKA